ncbi:MAG: hypothetical protein Q9162_000431 [Coniocarpon cinnabarinum]
MFDLSAILVGLLCALSVAHAQSTPTSSAPPTIHTVNVGRGDFRFDPNTTLAEPGDIITFNFFPTNHSVVRAAYGLPCIPIENSEPDVEGFASPNFLTQSLSDPPQWNLTVNDTEPIFYYCTAIGSCTPQGMVGVINPNASVSLQDQYDEALKAPYMLVPGQPFPDEGSETRPQLTANPSLLTATPTGVATATATTTATAAATHSGGSKLSGGAIAGIVVAAVAFIGLLAAVFWLLGHRRGQSSTTAGQSMVGGSNRERTAAWAAESSTGTWGGSSEAGATRAWAEKGPDESAHRHGPSTGNVYPASTPMTPPQQSNPSMGATYFPNASSPQPTAELGNNEITELEAPHMLQQDSGRK